METTGSAGFALSQKSLLALCLGAQQLLGRPAFTLSDFCQIEQFPGETTSRRFRPRRGLGCQVGAARFFQKLLRTEQSRQVLGNAVQCRGPRVAGAVFL